MTDTVIVRFPVDELRPDSREYRQNSVVFKVQNLEIGVELEVTKENFCNLEAKYIEEYTLWELGQGEKPALPDPEKLILTPAGLKKIQDQLEEPYNSPGTDYQNSDLFEGEETDF